MRIQLTPENTMLLSTSYTKVPLKPGGPLSAKARRPFEAAFGPTRTTIQTVSEGLWSSLSDLVRLGSTLRGASAPVELVVEGRPTDLENVDKRFRRMFVAKATNARLSIRRTRNALTITWARQNVECVVPTEDPFEGKAVRFLPHGISPEALKTYNVIWRDAQSRAKETHTLAMCGDDLREVALRISAGLDTRANDALTLGPIRFYLITTRGMFWKHIRDHLRAPQVAEVLARRNVVVLVKRPPPGSVEPFFGSVAFVQPEPPDATSTPEHVFFGIRPTADGIPNAPEIPYMHLRPKRVEKLDPSAAPFVATMARRLTEDFFAVWNDPASKLLFSFGEEAVDPVA